MSLGENIYKHRCAKNWSQTDLAEALDVSRQSISKWENGTLPNVEYLIALASLFDLTVDEILANTKLWDKDLSYFAEEVKKYVNK